MRKKKSARLIIAFLLHPNSNAAESIRDFNTAAPIQELWGSKEQLLPNGIFAKENKSKTLIFGE